MEQRLRQAEAVIDSLFKGFLASSEPADKRAIEIARMADLIGTGDDFTSSGELLLAVHTSPYSRVCSLSANPYSMAMWSHYANGHQGVCLEFELSVGKPDNFPYPLEPKPVRYLEAAMYVKVFSAEYLARTLNRLDGRADLAARKMDYLYTKLRRLYLSKMSDWSYEHEWRIFGRSQRPYYDLREGEYLSRILLGPRINRLHRDILREIVPDAIPVIQTTVVDGAVKEVGDF
jgi:hypothetical protein